jgi:hypothetical protein
VTLSKYSPLAKRVPTAASIANQQRDIDIDLRAKNYNPCVNSGHSPEIMLAEHALRFASNGSRRR